MWPAPGPVLGEGRCAGRWQTTAMCASRGLVRVGQGGRGLGPGRPEAEDAAGTRPVRDATVDGHGGKGSGQSRGFSVCG